VVIAALFGIFQTRACPGAAAHVSKRIINYENEVEHEPTMTKKRFEEGKNNQRTKENACSGS
jgi:hypothetical protein